MRGIIALDIDGTVTATRDVVSPAVVSFITDLQQREWQIAFVTGRTVAFARVVTEQFSFPYYLACYNGALLMQMPELKILSRNYLPLSICEALDPIAQEYSTDYVIYTGYEHRDRCYYRPFRFPKNLMPYATARQKRKGEIWEAVPQFTDLPLEGFPSVKFFGSSEVMETLSRVILDRLGLHAPVCQDILHPGYSILQATLAAANKGSIVEALRRQSGSDFVIAAGDGGNDIDLFRCADIAIAMGDAPATLRAEADITAPTAAKDGLIDGLLQSMDLTYRRNG